MRAVVRTINTIDENSKKIVFKHFDQSLNLLAAESPSLTKEFQTLISELHGSTNLASVN